MGMLINHNFTPFLSKQYTQLLAKNPKEQLRKQKEDCWKPIIEEISALDQKKVHFKNLIKNLPTDAA